jgi:hypothetical protein
MDGLLSFGVAVFYGVAVCTHIMLPSIPITMIIAADQKAIVTASMRNSSMLPEFCAASMQQRLQTEPLCACLRTNSETNTGHDASMQCFNKNHGAPSEQELYDWLNLNFIFFHIFIVSSVYQFALRNSLNLDLSYKARDVQFSLAICSATFILVAVFSVFNYEHGPNIFALLNLMPHQLVLLMTGMLVYNNIFEEKISDEMRSAYKNALFSGLYKASIIPFIGVFIASLQSWTSLPMINFIYNILFCLCVSDLAYLMLNVDVNGDLDRAAARVRVKQAVFLIVITCLFAYTITTLLYMPAHSDLLLRVLSFAFLILLWVQHLFFDAAHTVFNSYDYERIFFMGDALLTVVRFLLFAFSIWLVRFSHTTEST